MIAMATSSLGVARPLTPKAPRSALEGINSRAAAGAAVALLAGAALLGSIVNPKQAALYVLGAALGLVLYHAAFRLHVCLAGLYRRPPRRGSARPDDHAGDRDHPVLSGSRLRVSFGQPVTGLVSPVGTSVLVGAFIFGIGMQLGGGCASGTLYTVGGGSARMVLTLAFFIVGSTIGAAHFHWWAALPNIGPVSLVKLWGPWTALAAHLAIFAAIAGATIVLEKRRHGRLVEDGPAPRQGFARFLRGPWPLVAGAVALAILNFVTLALSGRPWGITAAFALWGSKIAATVGIADVASWPYWQNPANARALQSSVLADVTSVMDFGIIVGALLAASLAGRFAPVWRIPLRSVVAAIVGGLLLGYGARLAYGCNIGAYFSGIASGSLHGWLWLVAAFAGNVVGTKVRPFFGLEVERTPRLTAC
jgi:uncharacterized membrane protein YedE/YeeE